MTINEVAGLLGYSRERVERLIAEGVALPKSDVIVRLGVTSQGGAPDISDDQFNEFVARFEVEEGVTSGDYLQGFLRGTRTALYQNGRESITLSIDEVEPRSVGALIALYERAVGFYGSLVGYKERFVI